MTGRESQSERVLAVLRDGPATAAEIHQRAGSCRLNSRISELRKRGYAITCEHVGGHGPAAYLYRLGRRDADSRKPADTGAEPSAERIGADGPRATATATQTWAAAVGPDSFCVEPPPHDNGSAVCAADATWPAAPLFDTPRNRVVL